MSLISEDGQHWTAQAVNWAQALIAFAGILLSCSGFVLYNESRITRLEERIIQQAQINHDQDERYYRTVSARNAEYEKLRNELNTKLDRIEAELVALKVAAAQRRP
jgi:hypothetical protein